MASPPIPLEALLELRRLLDSMQNAETRYEETPLVQEAPQLKQLLHQLEPADGPRKQKNRKTSFQFFQ